MDKQHEVIRIDYEPNARQAQFHACGADEVVYGGAKGGGKTCALVMECLAYALEHPGAVCYIFRETYEQLEANVIREWRAKVPKELYAYNASKYVAQLRNGSTIYFRYIASKDDAEGYNGRSIDWIGVDELTMHEEPAIQILLSCLRSPKGFPPRFRGTCNPGGIGHMWVKQRYIDATGHGQRIVTDEITGNRIAFVPATVYDNAVLMANDPAYVRRLENLPEARRRAFLHGDWDVFEGQYFAEWNRDIHVVEPYRLPAGWARFRALDYGLDMTACYWIAVDGQGRLTVYRELYQSGLTLSQAARRILEMSPVQETIDYTVASPDLWNRRQDTGKSGAEVMQEAGLLGLIPADNRRVPGWRVLREYLQPYQDEFEETRADIQFFSTCYNAIRTIPALIHDEKDPEDCAKEPHEITHAPEAIRYGVMSRPQPARRKAEPDVEPTLEERIWEQIRELDEQRHADDMMGSEW